MSDDPTSKSPSPRPISPSPSAPAPRPISPTSLPPNSGGGRPNLSNPNLFLVSNPGMAIPQKGFRATIARLLATAANGLLKLTRLGVSQAKQQSSKFAQRPEHTRQRVYAFGGYVLVVVLTLSAQLYEPNSLGAAVHVEHIALPEATIIFVRNTSTKVWKDVKLTLNGRYGYQGADLKPNDYISQRVDRFAAYDQNGKADFAPKEIVPHLIAIDCDRGHFEIDPDQQ